MYTWHFEVVWDYRIAFFNGVLWNLMNIVIIGWLLVRSGGWSRPKLATA